MALHVYNTLLVMHVLMHIYACICVYICMYMYGITRLQYASTLTSHEAYICTDMLIYMYVYVCHYTSTIHFNASHASHDAYIRTNIYEYVYIYVCICMALHVNHTLLH